MLATSRAGNVVSWVRDSGSACKGCKMDTVTLTLGMKRCLVFTLGTSVVLIIASVAHDTLDDDPGYGSLPFHA